MKNEILKNYLNFSIGTWLSLTVSFLSTPITSHLISPEEFGKASFFSTIYSLLLLVILSGTLNSLMRFYYKYEEKNMLFYSSLLIPLFGISILTFLLLFLKEPLAFFFKFDSAILFSITMILSILFGVFQQYIITLLRVQQKGMLYSFLNVLTQVVNLSVVLLYCLLIGKNFYAMVFAQLFSYFVVSFIGIFLVKNSVGKVKINFEITKEVFKYGYPFLFSGVVWWIVSGTDKIMIRLYRDFSELGLYSAANKLVSAMGVFTSGFNTMWYPYIYEKYEKEGEKIKERISKIFNYVTFLVIILSISIMLLKDLIFLLFARQYRQAANVSPFLLTYPAIMSMAVVAARGIDFKNKTFWFIVSDAFGAGINVLLNFLLIPILGAKGAAIASGVSYFSIFLFEIMVSQKLFYVPYKKIKTALSIILLYLSALINTFSNITFLSYTLTFIVIIILAVIYNEELKTILRNISINISIQ